MALRYFPVLIFAPVMAAGPGFAASPPRVSPAAPPPNRTETTDIVATVNGDVISSHDVDNRGRLFALSTGMPVTPEVLERLRPQVTRQLIDERLRLQEAQRRHIVVRDKQIADAIQEIEQRNGMASDALRRKLAADGVSFRTLVDQIRVQLGWTLVLRQQLGEKAMISDAEVAEQQRLLAAQTGQPEYQISEIFVPIDDPARADEAQRFADTVIAQLRSGAPFPVVAAQFSQSQTALQGGDLGWVQTNQLDPQVARVVAEMPPGAVSNPIRVPGGISIVTLRAKREIGNDMATILSVREVFLPFTAPLNPQEPNEQQRQTLEKAKQIGATVHSCAQMEAAARANNSPRPADPGEVRLENVSPPAFKHLLATIPEGRPTQPLVAPDGIAVMIVCSREQKNLAEMTKDDVRNQLLARRVELASRQLQQDLRRRANIELRDSKGALKS
ncbi:MAG: peptidylprolyl isomerase [Acetobacteraceae bacterium]|nr:peptidylprolyl isomerase [Acetobacteraceae bacterium]